jgi:hypothetical protein
VIAALLCVAAVISRAEFVWLFLIAGAFGAIWYGGGLTWPRSAIGLLLQPWRKVPEPMLLGVAAVSGLILH